VTRPYNSYRLNFKSHLHQRRGPLFRSQLSENFSDGTTSGVNEKPFSTPSPGSSSNSARLLPPANKLVSQVNMKSGQWLQRQRHRLQPTTISVYGCVTQTLSAVPPARLLLDADATPERLAIPRGVPWQQDSIQIFGQRRLLPRLTLLVAILGFCLTPTAVEQQSRPALDPRVLEFAVRC